MWDLPPRRRQFDLEIKMEAEIADLEPTSLTCLQVGIPEIARFDVKRRSWTRVRASRDGQLSPLFAHHHPLSERVGIDEQRSRLNSCIRLKDPASKETERCEGAFKVSCTPHTEGMGVCRQNFEKLEAFVQIKPSRV